MSKDNHLHNHFLHTLMHIHGAERRGFASTSSPSFPGASEDKQRIAETEVNLKRVLCLCLQGVSECALHACFCYSPSSQFQHSHRLWLDAAEMENSYRYIKSQDALLILD